MQEDWLDQPWVGGPQMEEVVRLLRAVHEDLSACLLSY